MDLINRDYIDEYLTGLANYPKTEVMMEMEAAARKNELPIIRPSSAALLNVLVRTLKPAMALEVGTSIGYSGSVILNAMDPEGRLVTIETEDENRRIARNYFSKQGAEDRVTLIGGDAGEVLPYLEDRFDLIFLDGPKGQYINYLQDCIRLLNPGGLLICDDVLFYGMVASNELVIRRKITIVKRMRKFLHAISNHPMLDTTIIPIGDGMSVSRIKEMAANEKA